MAIVTGEVVPLGTVMYLIADPESGKSQETGLSWGDAKIRPDMENFVIETVNQVLNDEEVRVDDSITYNQLKNAFI